MKNLRFIKSESKKRRTCEHSTNFAKCILRKFNGPLFIKVFSITFSIFHFRLLFWLRNLSVSIHFHMVSFSKFDLKVNSIGLQNSFYDFIDKCTYIEIQPDVCWVPTISNDFFSQQICALICIFTEQFECRVSAKIVVINLYGAEMYNLLGAVFLSFSVVRFYLLCTI